VFRNEKLSTHIANSSLIGNFSCTDDKMTEYIDVTILGVVCAIYIQPVRFVKSTKSDAENAHQT